MVGYHKRTYQSLTNPTPYHLWFLSIIYQCLTPPCVPRVQSQVDEVIDVMQENISKVIERGERLEDLQDKSGESLWDSTCSPMCPHVQNVCLFKWNEVETNSAGNVLSVSFVLMVSSPPVAHTWFTHGSEDCYLHCLHAYFAIWYLLKGKSAMCFRLTEKHFVWRGPIILIVSFKSSKESLGIYISGGISNLQMRQTSHLLRVK